MSNEFTVTTTMTAEKVNDNEHQVDACNMGLAAFGLITDVVESKTTNMTRYADGRVEFSTVDFNRERETQLTYTHRNIDENVYAQLSNSFDKMVESLTPKAVEG